MGKQPCDVGIHSSGMNECDDAIPVFTGLAIVSYAMRTAVADLLRRRDIFAAEECTDRVVLALSDPRLRSIGQEYIEPLVRRFPVNRDDPAIDMRICI